MKRVAKQSRGIVLVPLIVEPVVVPVPLAIVPVQVQHIAVTVRVLQKCIKCRLFHHPSNTQKVVYYPASKML
jgi:hypothetical protein